MSGIVTDSAAIHATGTKINTDDGHLYYGTQKKAAAQRSDSPLPKGLV
jgi:hypothetical protein